MHKGPTPTTSIASSALALDGDAADLRMPAATASPPGARLGPSIYAGYGFGMIGERIFRDAPALLLLIFMTDYLAIPPALAGLAVFLPKIIVFFLDPLVGSFSDGLRTRWGRRRPLMLVGAVLTSISMLLFFHVPRFDSATVQAAYMSAIVLFGFTGYSLFSVPYLTLAAEIASTAGERERIMSYRVVFMSIGLVASAYAGGLVQALGGGIQGYETMSWLYAGICLATMVTTVIATGRTRLVEADQVKLSLAGQMKLVAQNKRYRLLLSVCFLQKLGEGIGYGSFAYFCIYVVQQPLSAIVLVVLSGMVGQLVSQPAWLWAAKRWSRPTLYTFGVIGWCVNLLAWLLMKGQSELWLIPLGFQGGLACGGFLMVVLSMLANAIAADARETGLNREGIYSGVWLATEKLAFAAGALVVGLVLGLFGFVESANGTHAVQTGTAVFGIAFAYCGLNTLVYLVSCLPIRAYNRYERPEQAA